MDHLSRLLVDVEIPWYKAFLGNLHEAFFAPKLPALEVTSTPVPVNEIWGLYGRQRKSFLISGSLQVGAVALLLLVGTNRTIRNVVKNNVLYLQIETPPPVAKVKLAAPDMATIQSEGWRRSLAAACQLWKAAQVRATAVHSRR